MAERPSFLQKTSSTASFASLSSSSSNRNPLHLKVNRLLSLNLEDVGTRTALDTLGQLDSLPIDGNITLALKRGGLRKEVDSKLAEGSREFLGAFTEVNDKLSLLQSHLSAMHVCCDEVQAELASANSGTKYLLEHAEGLRQQRVTTTLQQTLLHLFLTRFTLSPSELASLSPRGPSSPILPPTLFSAMDKLTSIRTDCAALLSSSSEETQVAGMDLMEYTKVHLEGGYERIFKWACGEVRGQLGGGGTGKEGEVGGMMRDAVKRLKERPDMLDEVLFLLGSTRSSTILNSFLDALTRGGPTGLPRPIELHAHDPIRYIGDMLAWIHQTMAGEREFLESLFSIKDDGRWVGSVRMLGKGGEEENRLRKLLDRDLEGCGRPLKIRVQQTIKSQEGSLMSYRIATLIHFYKVTMERTIGADALMVTVLTEIMNHAYEAFFETLHAHGRQLLRFIQPPSAALSAPSSLRETLSTLREILSVYSSSLLETPVPPSSASFLSPPGDSASVSGTAVETSPNPSVSSYPSFHTFYSSSHPSPSNLTSTPTLLSSQNAREWEFAPVLSAALDPALEMCEKMSEMRTGEWEKNVFGINCLDAVLGVLEMFGDVTRGRKEEIERELEGKTEGMIAEHYLHLLKDSGLAPILEALESKDAETPLSHLPIASSSSLTTALSTFSLFLSSTDTLSSPKLALLPPRYASQIHREALGRVSEAYRRVWEAVMDEGNRYEGRMTVMRRSREEVGMLLGVGE